MQLSDAQQIANELIEMLTPYCDRIEIGGSVRCKKNIVKDIELIIIPKKQLEKAGLFEDKEIIFYPIDNFILYNPQFQLRPNKLGGTSYGDKNKLLKYNSKNYGWIALDIFTADESNYMMVRFIRTGGAETNKLIAITANKFKMNLRIYESCFEDRRGNKYVMKSEEEIFKFLGLNYLPPEKRT